MKTQLNSPVQIAQKNTKQNYLTSKSVKKIIFIIACVAITVNVNAQYYKMYEGSGGSGEWFANSKKWLNFWGIQITAGDKVRATVNNQGGWYFAAPSSTYSDRYINDINMRLNFKTDIAIATDKEIAAKGFRLMDIGVNDNDYSKFYLGRNGDPTLIGTNGNWLRLGSSAGLAMWGNNNVNRDDSPHILLTNDGTFNVYNNLRVLANNGNSDGLYVKRGRNNDPTILNSTASWFRLGSRNGIHFWGNDNVASDDNPTMSVVGDKVGIGTVRPSYKLEVAGGIQMTESGIKVVTYVNGTGTSGWIGTISNHGFSLGANNGEAIYIDTDQRVYLSLSMSQISTIKVDLKNKYDIFVDKGILSEDYAIAPKASWSDFVFSDNYQLPKLSHVANFITQNRHLPDVPSAQNVAENGYSQHDMNKILLQKIEELTLYVIEQQKLIDDLLEQQGQ